MKRKICIFVSFLVHVQGQTRGRFSCWHLFVCGWVVVVVVVVEGGFSFSSQSKLIVRAGQLKEWT